MAAALAGFRDEDCVVLALPRGGVPVAAEVAKSLGAPLDLLLVRKIGAPGQPELAVGSVTDGGAPIIVRDGELMWRTGTSTRDFDKICARELGEIERRRKFYLGGRSPKPLAGKTVIVVDDGLATGNTMQAALHAVRQRKPGQVVMAVPVAPAGTLEKFRPLADRVVCLETPEPFGAVGFFYDDFEQVNDQDVVRLLAEQERRLAHSKAKVGDE
ncbi:MAG TPA: phosphoribosyltransferase family protein [Rhizomicrobium sp.]|nr:phosphoribosyltransferase family protein [Rhizomicrobium sp.]